jgi:hypothetical protein
MGRIFGQPRRTPFTKAVRPQKNRRSRSIQSFGSGIKRYGFCREQANTGTQDNSLRRCFCSNPSFKDLALLFGYDQSIGWFPHGLNTDTANDYFKDVIEIPH